MPDVSDADMAVVPTGADDGSTRARAGADEPEVTVQDILEAIMAAEELDRPGPRTRRRRRAARTGELPGRGGPRRRDRMFDGMATRDKDPRKALHVQEVPTPELAPGEALVAVMASAINYNTVWTSIFEPMSTFRFLQRYGRLSELTTRHDLPYHVVGSDAAGVVLRIGPGVTRWRPGDEVVAHCLSRRAGGRRRARRHHARPAAADLGLRDQLRRAGRAGRGQGQPAHAQAART